MKTADELKKLPTFKLLWAMVDELEKDKWSGATDHSGTIISRYASIIDGR